MNSIASYLNLHTSSGDNYQSIASFIIQNSDSDEIFNKAVLVSPKECDSNNEALAHC